MLTIVDINRAIDRLGVTAFVPRTKQRLVAAPVDPRSALAQTDGDVLEPEIRLPEQLENAGKRCTMPEHRLMLAVMEDAVHVYQTACGATHGQGRKLFRETADWFASDDTSSPFCFVTICQLLGLDPDYLRAGLRRWRDRQQSDVRVIPLRIRHVGGSRHRVIESRASRRRA
jgi:hypothetical protein